MARTDRPARDDAGKEVDGRRTYVLDTSVLIADPRAVYAFDEHDVCIPAVVVKELEGHKGRPDTGPFAREALRILWDLRVEHDTLRSPVPVNDHGGHLFVELNHQREVLPDALRDGSNDARILTVAKNLQADGRDVVLVTKDLAFRLNADIAEVPAEEYLNEQVRGDAHTGMVHLDVDGAVVDALYAEADGLAYSEVEDQPAIAINSGVVLAAGRQSALARLHADKVLRPIDAKRTVHGLSGRSAEQRVLIDLLTDDTVKVVSAGGPAGGGKTVIAAAAGIEAAKDRNSSYRRVVVYRPTLEVGGKAMGIGFLPGAVDEKLAPYKAALDDVLETLGYEDEQQRRGVYDRYLFLDHLGFVRGRTLRNAFVIVDEAQQLERGQLLTLLSRIGEGSKIVLCHDVAQRDNPYVGRHDGIAAVVSRLMGHPIFGHVSLSKVERSEVAELVTGLLDDGR